MANCFSSFNTSVWNALWIVVPMSVGTYIFTSWLFGKGTWWYFDPKHNHDKRLESAGDFEPHAARYQDMAKLVIALSAGAIGFTVNSVVSTKDISPTFGPRLQAVAPIVVGFFGSSITSLIAFICTQTIF
jgi:hypothetical protein